MPILASYISFPGTAAKAFALYHELLGGELSVMTYGEFPSMEGMEDVPADAVAHATLTLDGCQIAGGDGFDPSADLENSNYSILHTGVGIDAEAALIQRFVEAGSTVLMPFGPVPWGGPYGPVRGPSGVRWALHVEVDRPRLA